MSSPDDNNDDPKAKKSREEDHSEEPDDATLTLEEFMKGLQAEFALQRALWLAAEERAEKAEKQTKKERALREGTYYATFDEVWEPDAVLFACDDYKAMIRERVPFCEALDSTTKTPFLEILENAAKTSTTVAASDKESERTTHGSTPTEKRIRPVEAPESNFVHRDTPTAASEAIEFLEESDQIQERAHHATSDQSWSSTSNESGAAHIPIAHLVPASAIFASLYHHVAIWVFGLKERAGEPIFVQKLIHGSKPAEPHPEPAKRSTGTGLKHMICNKIRLSGHYEFFDLNPCLLIVPVLSLQQAKEWDGHGYHAIFMISTGNKEKDKGFTLQRVASTVRLQFDGEVASKPEIEVARDLLIATIKALAYALVERSGERENWVTKLSAPSKKELKSVRDRFADVTGTNLIQVPKESHENDKPVRKISFVPFLVPPGKKGHPAPDPLLLAVKAAVNWSTFHGQKLMATEEDCDENDSHMSERSIAAMDGHLAMLEQYERTRREDEIMNMTINIP